MLDVLRRPVPPICLALVCLLPGACGGSGPPKQATFSESAAPFTFSYPGGFDKLFSVTGKELRKPTFRVSYGTDETNLVQVSTYRLAKPVESYSPATFDADVQLAMLAIARSAGLTIASRSVGTLGPLKAKVFNLVQQDGPLRT